MTETPTTLKEYEPELVVQSAEQAADGVVVLTLVHPEGQTLPPLPPGDVDNDDASTVWPG